MCGGPEMPGDELADEPGEMLSLDRRELVPPG
jgi:hypothetical protein